MLSFKELSLPNKFASNPLVEGVLAPVRGGGARCSAPFDDFYSCDVVDANILPVEKKKPTSPEERESFLGERRSIELRKLREGSYCKYFPRSTFNFPFPKKKGGER